MHINSLVLKYQVWKNLKNQAFFNVSFNFLPVKSSELVHEGEQTAFMSFPSQ